MMYQFDNVLEAKADLAPYMQRTTVMQTDRTEVIAPNWEFLVNLYYYIPHLITIFESTNFDTDLTRVHNTILIYYRTYKYEV